ncbi:non-ribosomal peptide synthetase [Cohnella lupini]|uniref:Amino acid adenylation domain-containing protein n=1 Tax=Cohnella lupini TaxID=1294267 RepID=A0A3D9I4C2_9BACL|nr:non-ribosomal peptide synthetase [Cohnella lupini]RED56618.1 amino acid adenylation domain-containing protein [Cohnella lupini]
MTDERIFPEAMTSSEYLSEKNFWLEQLAGNHAPSHFFENRAKANQSVEYGLYSIRFPKELSEKIMLVSNGSLLSTYILLLSGVTGLLSIYSDNEDILVGTPLFKTQKSNNNHLLALRTIVDRQGSYRQLLNQVKQTVVEADKHPNVSYEEIAKTIHLSENDHGSKELNTVVLLENIQDEYQGRDTVFSFKATDRLVDLSVRFNASFIRMESIERLVKHLIAFMLEALGNPDSIVSAIDLLSEADKQRILRDFNATEAEYPRDKTIHELFEAQVEKTPDNAAVIFERQQLTYRELNARANQLARVLREKGVQQDNLVGLMAERSPEMIVGILAILKAGGAYVPVDPAFPEERVRYMLQDSGAKLLLTQPKWVEMATAAGVAEFALLSEETWAREADTNLAATNGPESLAYVIYTSGSTGLPKGVMVEHASVVNLLTGLQTQYPLKAEGRYLLKTTNTFDVSAAELFGWFFEGGTLVVLPEGDEKEPKQMANAIRRHGVTHINFVPTMLRAFLTFVNEEELSNIPTLQYVFTAGEAVAADTVQLFHERMPQALLANLYGPTEATVYATGITLHPNTLETNVPIGKPLQNTQTYIVGESGDVQPIGVPGELCIGGTGLSRGYLNRPELTAERFVPNPFVSGERMYKTGDLARWQPDGNIEYLGRIDHQVKIRGYRIELGEIEAQLLQSGLAREAIVIARENALGQNELCAYVVAENRLSVARLRGALGEKLPSYMIPTHFMQLDKLPLLPNGKIDRKALPEPDGKLTTGIAYVAPRTVTEQALAEIWQDVLGVERVGIHDNFFDLGGHSLRALTLLSRLHRRLGVEISLQTIFKHPTIEGLAEAAVSGEESVHEAIQAVPEQPHYPISSAQKRMYLVSQLEEAGTSYNMPAALLLEGKVDRRRIELAMKLLIAHHESLRTSFEMIEGTIVQIVHRKIAFAMSVKQATKEEPERIVEAFIQPFDLSAAPLLRTELVELATEKHLLLFDMHHIVSDGVSMGVLMEQFKALYAGEELPELRIQYKDYAAWQRELAKSESMRKQEAYWLKTFAADVPTLQLPTDYPRPAIRRFEGSRIRFALNQTLTEKLKRLALETGSTLYMVLLAAYSVLLSKYSGQEDVVIGSPIAGRTHADVERVLGMFVNTLAMRSYPSGDKTFAAFLREVKGMALEAFEHQEYPFEELVEKLDLTRDMSRNPLFDTMFVLQNTERATLALPDLHISSFETAHPVAKFDLAMEMADEGKEVVLHLEYSTALFKPETIVRMGNHFSQLLQEIASNPHIPLKDIAMLSKREKEQIEIGFNGAEAQYPQDKTLHGLFEEQVLKTPDGVAVIHGDRQLTYRELDSQANLLALELHAQGVGAEQVVAICMERSLEMAVGLLGILKAGGTYLPLDLSLPEERIRYMLEDSRARWIVTQEHLAGTFNFGIQEIRIEDVLRHENEVDRQLEPRRLPLNLAYVIYTSGTTGTPKGVLIEHRSIANSLQWRREAYGLKERDVVLQLFSYAFDAFLTSFFAPLLSGARVILLGETDAKDAGAICKAIKEQAVTHLICVPSLYQVIKEQLPASDAQSLRHVTLGGEAIPRRLIEESMEKYPQAELANEYGPTENSVVSTAALRLNKDDEVTIGKPVSGVQAYIVNAYLQPVPIGVAGELCVGGIGLARGYLNRPDLTEEKFVPNPFIPGERMYRTGDLARWLPDGNIDYLGRIDHQVKIRGYRIELNEVEAQLLRIGGMKEAAVVTQDNKRGEQELCAYVVTENELTVVQIRKALSQTLPRYMIPTYIVLLEKLPLTPNGKLDRKALPAADGHLYRETEYVAPRNEAEQTLATIWQNVLGVNPIGVYDNFFELGGNSLKMMQMVQQIHLRLNRELALSTVFTHSTIDQLAGQLLILSSQSKANEWNLHLPDKLFCLPPVHGYGIAYSQFANALQDEAGVIAFDFIEEQDRIEQYVQKIASVQPEGPIRIVGYSAGGILGLELVKALELQGREVSDLILLDSFPPERSAPTNREIEEWAAEYLNDFLNVHAYLQSYRGELVNKLKSYRKYCDNLKLDGPISADIHLIQAEIDKNEAYMKQTRNEKSNYWKTMTNGQFNKYAGAGIHQDMLTDSFVQSNVDLIKPILRPKEEANSLKEIWIP